MSGAEWLGKFKIPKDAFLEESKIGGGGMDSKKARQSKGQVRSP